MGRRPARLHGKFLTGRLGSVAWQRASARSRPPAHRPELHPAAEEPRPRQVRIEHESPIGEALLRRRDRRRHRREPSRPYRARPRHPAQLCRPPGQPCGLGGSPCADRVIQPTRLALRVTPRRQAISRGEIAGRARWPGRNATAPRCWPPWSIDERLPGRAESSRRHRGSRSACALTVRSRLAPASGAIAPTTLAVT